MTRPSRTCVLNSNHKNRSACAVNAARICRVSTQITGKPSGKALNSHWESGRRLNWFRSRPRTPPGKPPSPHRACPADSSVAKIHSYRALLWWKAFVSRPADACSGAVLRSQPVKASQVPGVAAYLATPRRTPLCHDTASRLEPRRIPGVNLQPQSQKELYTNSRIG